MKQLKEWLVFILAMAIVVGAVVLVLLWGFRRNDQVGKAQAEVVVEEGDVIVDPPEEEPTEFYLDGPPLNLTDYKRRRNQIIDKRLDFESGSTTQFTDDDKDLLEKVLQQEGRRGRLQVLNWNQEWSGILREIKSQ